MKKLVLAATLAALFAGVVYAEDKKPEHEVSFNAGITTDYRYRGISQSRLKPAISVGAGISNWMTYYVSTDIHPFTRQYLKATPWSDKTMYEKTSPMTNIKNAKTPTLIQHGELDKRVPIANAYELYQGLQDMGVETKLIVYKGFGHAINKPKERLAAMWHNWQWFGKYIWKEDIVLPSK